MERSKLVYYSSKNVTFMSTPLSPGMMKITDEKLSFLSMRKKQKTGDNRMTKGNLILK